MKHALFILLLLAELNCKAQNDSVLTMPAYDIAYYGFEVDKYCPLERQRADSTVKSGKLFFIEMGIKMPRYAKYMQHFCKPYSLIYCFMPEDMLGYEGINPMRCYIANMDSAVKRKYGMHYQTDIIKKADSCYFAQVYNDTVDEQYCNPLASLANANIVAKGNREVFRVNCSHELYKKFKSLTNPIAEPQMIFSLCIEANGSVSKYTLTGFYSDGEVYYCDTLHHSPAYNGCGTDFTSLALTQLKAYTQWIPAKVEGHPVRTWHQVEVYFIESPDENKH